MSKFFFTSTLRGRGFSDRSPDGTITVRTAQELGGSPPPAPMKQSGCLKCGNLDVLKYRCTPVMGCVHGPGFFHVDCSKCGAKSLASDS